MTGSEEEKKRTYHRRVRRVEVDAQAEGLVAVGDHPPEGLDGHLAQHGRGGVLGRQLVPAGDVGLAGLERLESRLGAERRVGRHAVPGVQLDRQVRALAELVHLHFGLERAAEVGLPVPRQQEVLRLAVNQLPVQDVVECRRARFEVVRVGRNDALARIFFAKNERFRHMPVVVKKQRIPG